MHSFFFFGVSSKHRKTVYKTNKKRAARRRRRPGSWRRVSTRLWVVRGRRSLLATCVQETSGHTHTHTHTRGSRKTKTPKSEESWRRTAAVPQVRPCHGALKKISFGHR